jgi:hypothetical protein
MGTLDNLNYGEFEETNQPENLLAQEEVSD